jgi:ATP-dependent RNA/DNA helicase IGHMBP2
MSTSDTSVRALQNTAKLWAREQETIRETHREQRDTLPLAERVRRGWALTGLRFENAESVRAGRRQLWFHLDQEGALEQSRISVGDPIALQPQQHAGGSEASKVRRVRKGIVARRTQTRIAIGIDGVHEAWLEQGLVNLEAEAPETTFERGRSAIQRFQRDASLSRLRKVLFGEEAPRYSEVGKAITFRDDGLNDGQRAAIRFALSAQDVALIHGPPGTGKTRTLVEFVRQALLRGESALVTAASHTAVDNLAERLIESGMKPLRLGHPARVSPAVEARSLDVLIEETDEYREAQRLLLQAKNLRIRKSTRDWAERARKLSAESRHKMKEARGRMVRRCKVVCATAAGTDARLLGDNHYDWVILDEATQAPDPIALAALQRGSRAILAGDPKQLPPTVTDPKVAREGLGTTLFERLAARWEGEATRMLTLQYRMHETLMHFPSESMYEGRLEAAEAVRAHRLEELPGVAADAQRPLPWHFLDTAATDWREEQPEGSSSVLNPKQAEQTANEIRRLIERGVDATQVAAITPYAAQAERLRSLLREPATSAVEIGTVDGFQGREKEAIVVDLVRSNPEGEIGFLSDERRMNVALTRARRCLMVIGDGRTLEGNRYYAAMLQAARRAGAYVEL